MTETPANPDVEALIAEIQQQAASAESSEAASPPEPEYRLDEELRIANLSAHAGQGSGFLAKIFRRLLRFLIEDINRFQAASVRSLNLLARRVKAATGEEQAQVLECVQRTEAKQVQLEKRIHALEEQLKDARNAS
jgi:hypothetical protein